MEVRQRLSGRSRQHGLSGPAVGAESRAAAVRSCHDHIPHERDRCRTCSTPGRDDDAPARSVVRRTPAEPGWTRAVVQGSLRAGTV